MSLLALCAGMAIFCVLMAVWLLRSSKRSAREAVLAERLGTDESMMQANALLRGEQTGALVKLLEEGGNTMDTGGFVSRLVLFTGLSFLILLLLLKDLGAALFLSAVLTPLFMWMFLLRRRSQRIRRISEQLPEALEVMTISLRAGQSLEQTIRLTASQLDDPVGGEFTRVSEETELGRPLEMALVNMAERLSDVRPLRTFVVSVLVLRQTGGNLIEVLESIIDTMRQQTQYERKLQAMTAEGRSSSRMLGGLPVVFVVLAWFADPTYIGKLLEDPLGQGMALAALTLYVLGMLWIRRLINPET
ncbi:MAG: tight adherence protein B [Bradymonadia bacterium]|jgi:tight adherence protein B